MNPEYIIEELNLIGLDASVLGMQLREQNRNIPVGWVRESQAACIYKKVEKTNREILFLYAVHEIPDGWQAFENYKARIRSYKSMDELDRDIELINQIENWVTQSKAYVELINDLLKLDSTPAMLTQLCASYLHKQYVNNDNEIDKLKSKLLIQIMSVNKLRQTKAEGAIMNNNFTIHGDVNGQLNVAGKSINSPALKLSLAELIANIESADAPSSEKESAKSKLQEFLRHPLVASIIGGVAGHVGL